MRWLSGTKDGSVQYEATASRIAMGSAGPGAAGLENCGALGEISEER